MSAVVQAVTCQCLVSHFPLPDYETYLQTAIQIRDHEVQHHQLQADLAEHLWQQFGRDS